MSRYFPKDARSWEQTVVPGGTIMDRSLVWEGGLGVGSGFFRMPKGMNIPEHTHEQWVQVMVLEGEMAVESKQDGSVRIGAGGCYFVEPGDTHVETAMEDTLVLVTWGEFRPEFMSTD